MEFLSDEWFEALDRAAAARTVAADDPLTDVQVTIGYVIDGGPSWRFVVDAGTVRVDRTDAASTDVHLRSDRPTATAIAEGRRSALDAFIAGDLVLGGDVRALLDHRGALESVGDLFATVRATTTFA